ncbi:glycosyltransferase [Geothermobacter hydrogeniphilus]|uniref:Glycosyltransferase n=1 Tax=Geothermobacter hydrogeniphilus TaxID=1969733 RepID=A0A2K2H672_9BACT|nr:glycosyltransferase family 2 protein [Geothermobacter hydrogeniphilus]PNU18740.1 glycosyltransferase [Geothermobacter hydrogeniphilus]
MQVKTVKISIVMPCYQQAMFLEEAVRSVLEQQGAEAELLVMDPGSTDGSRELLQELQLTYGERLVLHFEADQGQSDAVNRGIARAKGPVLGWLNSDDRLRPGALAQIGRLLDRAEPAWLYGRAGMIDARGQAISSVIVHYKNWRGRRFSRLKLLTENFIPQMAVFWNRPLWDLAGGVARDLHLDMDYDLWLRFANIVSPVVLSDFLADFRVHGEAKGSRNTEDQLDAAWHTARRHAQGLGWQGQFMLFLHRVLSWRTRQVYRFIKP